MDFVKIIKSGWVYQTLIDDRLRGFRSAEGHILPFPIDFDGRPHNTLTLPCERVIYSLKDIGVTTWPFRVIWRHRSRDRWTVFYRWSIATIRLSFTVMEMWSLDDFRVTASTFLDHVTSSFTWPFNSAYAVSYWWSIVTIRVSCTVMEIWSLKDYWVTTLTFWGNVTSSVTWPFDSPYWVSYRWSMVTMRLSYTVSEI